jgi:hypothetical protein
MIKQLHINKALIALIAGAAVFALACSNSASPTTPVATESQALLVPASGNDLGDGAPGDVAIFNFWATALGEPELIVSGDRQYIRLVVACRHSPNGPDTPAVFRFYGKTMKDGAKLWNGADFYATVKKDWKDGRDYYPAYRVLDCRMPDGR